MAADPNVDVRGARLERDVVGCAPMPRPAALAIVVVLVASRAIAGELLAPLGPADYVETFAGETAFPLAPDFDSFALGGMTGFQRGDPLPAFPALGDDVLGILASEADPSMDVLQSTGAQLSITAPDERQIGLLGRFEAFATVTDPQFGAFQTLGVTLLDTSLDNGASAYLLEFQNAGLRIVVSNLGPLFLTGYDDEFLSPTAEAAIRAGDPFEIELLFDEAERTARASLTVGAETVTTIATNSVTFDAMDAIDRALVVAATNNNGGPLASIAADATRFELRVPEPGSAAAAGAIAAALLALSRRA